MISLRSESAIVVEKISVSGGFFISFASNLIISKACNSEALLIKLWTRICSIDSYLRFQQITFKILLINMLIGFKKISLVDP